MSYKDKEYREEYLKSMNVYLKEYRKQYKNHIHFETLHKTIVIEYLGFILLPGETIHHINGNNEDNRIENLYLFETRSQHAQYHASLRRWANQYPYMNEEEARKTYPFLKTNLPQLKEDWQKEYKNALQQRTATTI